MRRDAVMALAAGLRISSIVANVPSALNSIQEMLQFRGIRFLCVNQQAHITHSKFFFRL